METDDNCSTRLNGIRGLLSNLTLTIRLSFANLCQFTYWRCIIVEWHDYGKADEDRPEQPKRIEDGEVWVPRRTTGKMWLEVVQVLQTHKQLDRILVEKVFAAPALAPLTKQLSPQFPPEIIDPEIMWTTCDLVLRIFRRFWQERKPSLEKDGRENDHTMGELNHYYGGLFEYLVHDKMDFRYGSSDFAAPLGRWNEFSSWRPYPDWLDEFCSFIDDEFHPKDLPKNETQLYDKIVPGDAWVGDDHVLTVAFWLFDTYLPVHYAQTLSKIVSNTYTDQQKNRTLCRYEIDFLNSVYCRYTRPFLACISCPYSVSKWSQIGHSNNSKLLTLS